MRRFAFLAALCLASLFLPHAAKGVVGIGGPMQVAPAGAAFPTSGLTLWVNGRTGITTGATFTWADQSTAGFGNLTQSTGAAQPANGGAINGHNAVLFSGSSGSQLLIGSSPLSSYVGASSPNPFSAAIVFQFTGSATAGGPSVGNPDVFVTSLVGNYVNWGFNVAKYSVTPAQMVLGFTVDDGSNKYVSQIGALYANPHWMLATLNASGAMTIQVDGSAATTTTGVGANVNHTLPFTVGSSNGLSTLQQFDGPVGEVMVWNRVLTGTEITSLGTFFASKWGTLGP